MRESNSANPQTKHAVSEAIEESSGAVDDYLNDEHASGAMNFLVGRVMYKVGGGADPGRVKDEIEYQLEEEHEG